MLSPLEVKDEPSEMMVTSDGPVVRRKRRVPLSVEAEEFSLGTGSKIRVPMGGDRSRTDMPSREIPGGIVGRSKAMVSTTAGCCPGRLCWGGSPGRYCRD